MAAKGGGAWKVAYADFVTAMMAFFLVMWIAGQDQQIRRAVSYYFQDPLGADERGNSKKPSKTGSVSDFLNVGSVPQSDSVATGRGRNSYTFKDPSSAATKLVSDWIQSDKNARAHWREQAARHREAALKSKDVVAGHETLKVVAAQHLARQLQDELAAGIPEAAGVYQDLLHEVLSRVNWTELAEDILAL